MTKTFDKILKELNIGRVPMKHRKGVNDGKVFCPSCGLPFVYYKEGTKCRHCLTEICGSKGK